MPVMSKLQFIALADRIAAEYDLLLSLETQITSNVPDAYYQDGVSFPARLMVDLTGTGTHVLLRSATSGTVGNVLSFTMLNPGGPSSPLSSQSLGNDLAVSLQTDSNGNIISAAEDVVAFLKSNSDFAGLEVVYPVTNVGGIAKTFPRTQLTGGVGTGSLTLPVFTLITLRPGAFGNSYTLTLNQGVGNNAPLTAYQNGSDLVISLGTDGSGNPSTTVTALSSLLGSLVGTNNVFQYSQASNFLILSQDPSAIVSAQTKINLSGGGNGFTTNIVLTPPEGSSSGTADPDVSKLTQYTQPFDTEITAKSLSQGINVLERLVGGISTHFTLVGYAGGLQGFLTANNILVHKNFSIIQNNRTGIPLLAASVFRPDILILATISVSGAGLVFTAGTALGTATGNQSDTNFGPQNLIAILIPNGGTLAANWSFTLSLVGSDGSLKVSDPISFTTGATSGTIISITASSTDGRFYAVNGATLVSGGTSGDKVIINQVVERKISL